MKEKVLLVEDEPRLARVIADSLEQRGYSVQLAVDGKQGELFFDTGSFSICIIDVMMPKVNGFTLAKQIRTSDKNVPILFITALTSTDNLIEGYQSGGNDYLKKPFSLEELFLRVAELLKRNEAGKEVELPTVKIGALQFTPHRQLLKYPSGKEMKLSFREAELLMMLYKSKNKLLERKHTLKTLWGDDSFYHARTMDVFITRIRKLLKEDVNIEIINVRGEGYKLIC